MRFNSIICAFLFVLIASAFALGVFVQTESFGNLVSRVISDVSQKRAQVKVGIDSIKFSVFPPGMEINRLTVDKDLEGGHKLSAEFGKVGFYLKLIEIEEKKLSFSEITVQDSVFEMTYEKTEEELKEIDRKIIDQIFSLPDKLPVRIDTVLIQNAKVFANYDIVDVKRLKIFRKGENYVTRFHLGNIKPVESKELSIDEIWGDAEITRTNIEIQRLKVQHDVHSLLIKGDVKNYPLLKKAEAHLLGESNLNLKGLHDLIELPEIVSFENGSTQLTFNIDYQDSKASGEANVSVKDFKSSFFDAESVNTKVFLSKDKIGVSHLELMSGNGQAKLLSPVVLVDLATKKYLQEPIHAEATQIQLNKALKILGPSFDIIKGHLNGELDFSYSESGNMHFKPRDGFIVNGLGLVVGKEKPFTVLMAKKAKFKDSEFSVINGEFQMGASVELPNSLLEVDGFVNKKEARFSIVDAKVNLEDLGNIANIDLLGQGRLSIDVSGPLNDTELRFKGKLDNFGVLGYALGNSDIDMSLSLKDSTVNIKRLESVLGSTQLSGSGAVNYDNLDIAIGINSPQTSYQDLSLILKPIFSKLDFLPSDLDFKAGVDAYIFGKTRLNQLKVKSDVKFSELVAYGEGINSGSFDVEMANEVVGIKRFSAQKDKGTINGDFSFSLPSKRMELDFRWDNINLSSFTHVRRLNFNFDSDLNGKIKGEGRSDDYVFNLETKLFNTKSQNDRFPDSLVKLKIMPKGIAGDMNLFGEVMRSKLDLSLLRSRRSTLAVDLDVPNLKPYLTAFFGEHLRQEEFKGNLKMDLDASFGYGLEKLDLRSTVTDLNFNHEEFSVSYQAKSPQFVVTDGRISKWDMSIQQPDVFLKTSGSGSFGKSVSLIHEFHVNSKLMDILLAPVLSSEGFIRNVVKIEGRKETYDLTVNSRSEGLSMSFEGAPFPLNNLKYSLDYADKRLIIHEVSTVLDAGSIALKGDVFFDDAHPDINIKYYLDRAEFPILGKSLINASGEGIILGNGPPYSVGGEIVLNKVQIVNEITEFTGKSTISSVRFLPKNQESIIGKWLNLNLNVKAENPITVSNSMLDVSLKGELRLTGNPMRPRGDGRLYAPTGSSRVFFKNGEYFITAAEFNFNPKKDITSPEFDVSAMTYIASYRVMAKAYGDLDKFNFDLTSDPALPRNSILSLIAFGYTDELQNTLTSSDKQNLTNVGVGSFVFDRFKISDILNKQFGFQINLGTVVEQSRTASMLSGRSAQDTQGLQGRMRSATKIELKKRLDEAMTLSVSSTMGGGIGQRQSMNLSYSINKKVQLEGVYELRTNEDGAEDIIDNSLGGDLKFRWSFK